MQAGTNQLLRALSKNMNILDGLIMGCMVGLGLGLGQENMGDFSVFIRKLIKS